jgi:uncharacterized protein
MRIIITGGTGWIGRQLAANLAADQHEVIVLSRNPDQPVKLPASTRVERWDGRSAAGWGQWADGADAIVNLAGERLAGPSPAYRWTEKRKQAICDSRRNAGLAVTEAVRIAKNKPKVLIQASGINYYDTGDALVDETAPAGSGFLPHVVSACWEASTVEVETLGVRRAIIRTGPVLGPDSPVLAPILLQFKLFGGGTIGNGKQWFPWVHIDDVIGVTRFLIDNPAGAGPFNLVAPNPVTNAEMAKIVGGVLGRPSWLPAPSFAFKLAFGEMAMTLLEGVHAEPKRLRELGYTFRFPTLETALQSTVDK